MKSVARFLMFLFFVLVVLAGFVFTLKNRTLVGLWLGTDFQSRPLSVWIIAAFICGGVLGLLVGFGVWGKLRSRVHVMQLQAKLQQNQQEISRLQQQLKSSDNQLNN